MRADVSDPATLAAAAEHVLARFGRIDVICNNAGVLTQGPLAESRIRDWEWLVGVNLLGVVHGIRVFVPHLRAHGEGGHVVNTASVAGLSALPGGLGIYTATKHAVVALSEVLREELAPEGIGVSVLCPGGVRTRIHEAGRNRPEVLGGPDADALRAAAASGVAEIGHGSARGRRARAARGPRERAVRAHASRVPRRLRGARRGDPRRLRPRGEGACVGVEPVLQLAGRGALVAGGGQGMGRATVLLLARLGAKLVVLDELAERANAVAAEARALGAAAEALGRRRDGRGGGRACGRRRGARDRRRSTCS